MYRRFHPIPAVVTALCFVTCTLLQGQTSAVDSYKEQEKELSGKRFKQKEWSSGQRSDLTEKAFSFKHWNKHYSSLGSRKWGYSVENTKDKKHFKTGMVEFSNKDFELAEWQGYLANLESRARINTDMAVRMIQDKRMYERMLQQAENFKDTGETLSLRDINRFQFRKNRPDSDVPVTKAGEGNDT